MALNPYESPRETNLTTPAGNRSQYHGWLVVVPIAWFFVLRQSGISSDFVQFSLPVAWALTGGTGIAMIVLAYSVRGWWSLLATPLWFFFLLALVVLWYWNVR